MLTQTTNLGVWSSNLFGRAIFLLINTHALDLTGSKWFDELLAHMSHFFCRAQTRIGVGRGVSEHSAL